MIDENIRFEKQGDLYKLFYDNGSKEYDMGISFMTNHNIEDYPITILEEINGRDCYLSPCKNVVIKLLNPPEKTKSIEIARDAGIEFSGDFILGIEKSLKIETNKGTAFSFKDNPDREKFVRFKELEISGNENSIFYFSKSNIKRNIDSPFFKSVPKKASEIKNNQDIFFSLRDDIQVVDLKDNIFHSEDNGGEIICDSLYVSLNAITAREDGSSDDSVSLLLSADAVYARNVNFGLVGALEIVNRGTKSGEGCKISISDTQIERPDYLEREDAAILEIDCDHLEINTNTPLLISGENRVECLGGKVFIDTTGDNLHDPLRLNNTKVFIPENGEAIIRRIEGKDSSLTLAQSEDNKYFIKRAYLANSEAKNISGDIYLYAENSKINGMTFEDNSGVVLTTNAPHDKGISNFVVGNILFKKDSSLEVKDTKGKDTSIKLSNIIVEGEAGLASKIDYSMESSILAKGTTYLASGDEELKILNSIFQGKNTISRVTSIANSKIENSVISASNTKIEDAELVDVTDYKAYLQRQANIQHEAKNISIITNEIEKL
jgi:hypothetical protein